MTEQEKKFVVIDGNAILHKAYHGLPPFRTTKGELVNAVYGFATVLLNLANDFKPHYIAAAFDLKGKTFRHEEYTEYKANRSKAPDDLYEQLPRIKELIAAFKIPVYEKEGFEADDILGTLARKAEDQNLHTYIVTGDLDTLQLVTDKTKVFAMHRGFSRPIIYDRDKVYERYKLLPTQITDMKALQGDNSDNIKGVNGIGPKTTRTLLQKYKNIENLYENLEEITGSTRTKLEKDRDSAFLSKKLATIVTDMDLSLDLAQCATHSYDENTLSNIFQELEFKSLLGRLHRFNKHSADQRIIESNTQPSLF